jgi:predicted heme/steroid binding protein
MKISCSDTGDLFLLSESKSPDFAESLETLTPSSKYNSRMIIPDYIVTQMELKRNTGERGTRKFIAYQGIVYDVTDCPKWRMDLHEQLHFAGQDLTSELPDAPHQEDVFSRPCVKAVGKLQNP